MKGICGKEALVSVGDNDFVCVIESSQKGLCARDIQTRAVRLRFNSKIAKELRNLGSAPNIELM